MFRALTLFTSVTGRLRGRAGSNDASMLKLVLTNMSQGHCVFDGKRRLLVYNARYADMYGLPPELTRSSTTLTQILEFRTANGDYTGSNPKAYIGDVLAGIARNESSAVSQSAPSSARRPTAAITAARATLSRIISRSTKIAVTNANRSSMPTAATGGTAFASATKRAERFDVEPAAAKARRAFRCRSRAPAGFHSRPGLSLNCNRPVA